MSENFTAISNSGFFNTTDTQSITSISTRWLRRRYGIETYAL
jgi:hypothetical protein